MLMKEALEASTLRLGDELKQEKGAAAAATEQADGTREAAAKVQEQMAQEIAET